MSGRGSDTNLLASSQRGSQVGVPWGGGRPTHLRGGHRRKVRRPALGLSWGPGDPLWGPAHLCALCCPRSGLTAHQTLLPLAGSGVSVEPGHMSHLALSSAPGGPCRGGRGEQSVLKSDLRIPGHSAHLLGTVSPPGAQCGLGSREPPAIPGECSPVCSGLALFIGKQREESGQTGLAAAGAVPTDWPLLPASLPAPSLHPPCLPPSPASLPPPLLPPIPSLPHPSSSFPAFLSPSPSLLLWLCVSPSPWLAVSLASGAGPRAPTPVHGALGA